MGESEGKKRRSKKVLMRNPALSVPTVESWGFVQTVCSHGDAELTAQSISWNKLWDFD